MPNNIPAISAEMETEISEKLSEQVKNIDVSSLLESKRPDEIITREVIIALSHKVMMKELVAAMFRKAFTGDVNMIRLIMSYVEGMPTQRSEVKINQTTINSTWTPEQMIKMRKTQELMNNYGNNQKL
jgi:transcriptional regulator of met regulon